MPGEEQEQEQERFEDYLALDRYLESLETGGTPRLPEMLTPVQARIYRMAALFRSASPEAAEPRPEFAAALQARLLQEQHLPQPAPSRPAPAPRRPGARKPALLSRRVLLAGGTAAAASFVAGVAADRVIEAATANPPAAGTNPTTWNGESLVPADVPSQWFFVTTMAELGNEAVSFAAGAVVGYVLRSSSASTISGSSWEGGSQANSASQERIIALSAACTHMGCIVQWQNADHKFHCPCHGGLFTANGEADAASSKLYLRPLPQLETKIDQGKVYVRVPTRS